MRRDSGGQYLDAVADNIGQRWWARKRGRRQCRQCGSAAALRSRPGDRSADGDVACRGRHDGARHLAAAGFTRRSGDLGLHLGAHLVVPPPQCRTGDIGVLRVVPGGGGRSLGDRLFALGRGRCPASDTTWYSRSARCSGVTIGSRPRRLVGLNRRDLVSAEVDHRTHLWPAYPGCVADKRARRARIVRKFLS